MGGSSSSSNASWNSGSKGNSSNDNIEEIVYLMFPVYYDAECVNSEGVEKVREGWKMILRNTAPGYVYRRDSEDGFGCSSSIEYFYKLFYGRLFDIHPAAEDLFKNAQSQGKFLVEMVSLSMSELADPLQYKKTLTRLADIHNKRGVKAIEYGVVGEVLFWSIRECLGAELYNFETHGIWVKLYSRMLKTMVPLAVAAEMKDASANQDRRMLVSTISLSAMEEQSVHVISSHRSANSNVGNNNMSGTNSVVSLNSQGPNGFRSCSHEEDESVRHSVPRHLVPYSGFQDNDYKKSQPRVLQPDEPVSESYQLSQGTYDCSSAGISIASRGANPGHIGTLQ
mmetsp:Transcript_14090/g.23440  ORF Transcript_14090/g.23440 Transcript_14090/m.23440 type:complete len:339 (+) Transcript_14090:50-1066(+)|eukprot:CAMPEP_0175018676 /NCGR_PEP_ID=MMETSP0005-20121125/13122_1 /TAXON_ID=420556 /ORGANISM="Ochromonas sp., Strain CCMP1393" /LENGTH=338 /DNA_ID=CAMNT_0016276301 /DNA_START=50 /DNA_END=1066 /DNA_ORIENTATION=+